MEVVFLFHIFITHNQTVHKSKIGDKIIVFYVLKRRIHRKILMEIPKKHTKPYNYIIIYL